MKVSGAVNGSSSGLKHHVHVTASVQITWFTLIQIVHTCTNPYYSVLQTEFVFILVTMLTTLEDPMCKCSTWYQWLSGLLKELVVCMIHKFNYFQCSFNWTVHFLNQLSLYWLMLFATMCNVTTLAVIWSYTLFNHGVVMLWGSISPLVQMSESTKKQANAN